MPSFRLPVFLTVILCAFTVNCSLIEHMHYDDIQDYEDHPCRRECTDDGEPMECEYDFLMEHYHTFTKACYNCPHNMTDCYRPHCIVADGLIRGLIVVNRMMPGPAVLVCENDIVRVRVHNKMDMAEGVTIHWHGALMQNSPHMDGVAMVTQCPIPVHTFFTYTFKAETPGTHFWHSHSGMQRGDGVFGALIIRQPPSREPHNGSYDHDLLSHTIIINDWWERETAPSFAYHHHGTGDNKPASMLINGKGIFRKIFDPDTNTNITTPREEYFVKKGQRYRFRIISNGLLNCPIAISIDGHTLTVIATDGSPVEPIEVQVVNVFAGERYDFILHAKQAIGNYLVRAVGLADCGKKFKSATQTAIIRYEGASEPTPGWMTPIQERTGLLLNPFNEKASADKIPVTQLTSLLEDDPAVTRTPDKTITLGMDFRFIDNPRFHNHRYYGMNQVEVPARLWSPQMNYITMAMPSVPPLTQLQDIPKELFCNNDTLTKDCSKEFCECIHYYQVDLDDVVEIVMIDEGIPYNANHPTHLHGHGFRVIAMDRVGTQTLTSTVVAMDERGEIIRNFTRPVVKDSVTVPDGGYTIVRFHANNPGIWFLHCHIEYHSEIGMGLLIQVGDRSEFPDTPPGFPTCGNYDFDYKNYNPHPVIEAATDSAVQCTEVNRVFVLMASVIALALTDLYR